MTNKAANKIKQRRERLKENQTPTVVRKPNKRWFWILVAISVFIIVYLSYSAYTSDFTNELIIPIIVAVTVLLLLIIWYLPKFYIWSLPIETGKEFDREKERLKLEDDTRKTFAQIIGGIVFLGGLIFTYNTFRLQQNTYSLQQEGQLTDRFTKAVAQLGDDKLEIRLGGMYALERIARDSPKDHWTVMEILSAYIRENAKKKQEIAENNSNKTANDKAGEAKRNKEITTDIQAALTIIGRRKIEQDSKKEKINLSRANLSEANLSEANLSGADLSGADLSGAFLSRTNLSEAFLVGTNLSGAFLSETNLSGTFLLNADLREARIISPQNIKFEELKLAIINENTLLSYVSEKQKAELIEISKKNLEEREILLNENNQK